ncbi:MAG TPA: hypothetical protein VNA12_09800 [Mycobacteriales bacterium]|nr:hypothetical protein [Mycobacteriales bacterium]
MTLRHRAVVAVLCAALAVACNGGDTEPAPTGPPADAIVLFKPAATDLNALDLRDKLLQLAGVEGVVYDQADKRLRVDFAADATAGQKDAVIDAALADASVAKAGDENAVSEGPAQQPAPGASASGSPS